MAQISSPHIWYPNGYPGTALDLRNVAAWSPVSGAPTKVQLRFRGESQLSGEYNLAAFEAAKQASVAAGG